MRGAFTGNRGRLHEGRRIVRFHAGDLWIICALRFKGRKRADIAGSMVARIAAEHLRRHLEASGFVVMKRPAGQAPSTTRHHQGPESET